MRKLPILVVLTAVVAASALAVNAATVKSAIVTKVGSGAARLTTYTDGTGSIYLNLKALPPGSRWNVHLWSGTCTALGTRVAVMPGLLVPATGAVARTNVLAAAQVGRTLRLVAANRPVLCATFGAVAPSPTPVPSPTPSPSPTPTPSPSPTPSPNPTAAPCSASGLACVGQTVYLVAPVPMQPYLSVTVLSAQRGVTVNGRTNLDVFLRFMSGNGHSLADLSMVVLGSNGATWAPYSENCPDLLPGGVDCKASFEIAESEITPVLLVRASGGEARIGLW